MISRFSSLDLWYALDFSLIFSYPLERQGLASKKFEICFYIFLPDYAAVIYIFQNFLFWKFRKKPRKRTTLLWSLMLLFPLRGCVATTTTLTFPWAFLFPVYVVSIKGSNRFQLKTKKVLEGTPSCMTTVPSIFALKLLEMNDQNVGILRRNVPQSCCKSSMKIFLKILVCDQVPMNAITSNFSQSLFVFVKVFFEWYNVHLLFPELQNFHW